MEINRDSLRRHYQSLPDEALLEIDPSHLTDLARACYNEEIARRGLDAQDGAGGWPEEGAGAAEADEGEFPTESDWLQDAVCVCTFEVQQGAEESADAALAADVLERAHIPCEVTVEEIATPQSRHVRRFEYRVMVPGPLSLKATSVLDVEIFNPKLEAEWRMHFEHLSAEELRAFDANSLCAGLLDRAARLKRAYTDELSRRKLTPGTAER